MRYSALSLVHNGLGNHQKWGKAWRNAEPKEQYDVIVIGGGGHGLGAAHYLAKEHGITDVAVLEKGWIGGGNTGRNTMTIRDNYVRAPSVPFHRESMKLWRGLSRELNFNVMLHERGMITFLQSSAGVSRAIRMANTMSLFDSEYDLLSLHELKQRVPGFSGTSRMPIIGGVYHRKIAMARHDAVAWGYARSADRMGVDIVQNCEVTDILCRNNKVVGVQTNRGRIRARKVGMAVAGHGSVVAAMAGVKLPVETRNLQAFVSTPVKPVLNEIFVLDGFRVYFMQSDKGELVVGGSTDPYPSYAQRGTPRVIETVVEGLVEVFPMFKRMKLLRHWAGMLDVTYDNSPIISRTDVEGFYVDVAGSGGFKTTPIAARMHADLIANDRPHPLIRDFGLDRFRTGRWIIEGGVVAGR